MIIAVGTLSLMDACLKVLSPHYSPFQVASIRGLSALPFIMVWIGIRGSYGKLLHVRIGLHAVRGAIGIMMADRAPGWGLGSHAFVAGGVGRLTTELGDGSRYFAEGGGGLDVGPIGIELGVKFAWNKLTEPVEHRFLTIPITLRGTLTF